MEARMKSWKLYTLAIVVGLSFGVLYGLWQCDTTGPSLRISGLTNPVVTRVYAADKPNPDTARIEQLEADLKAEKIRSLQLELQAAQQEYRANQMRNTLLEQAAKEIQAELQRLQTVPVIDNSRAAPKESKQ